MAPQHHHHHPGMMMMDPSMQGQLGPPGMPPQYQGSQQQQQQQQAPWSMNPNGPPPPPPNQFQPSMMSPQQAPMHPHMAHMRQAQAPGTPTGLNTPGSNNMMMPPPLPAQPSPNNNPSRIQPPPQQLPPPLYQIPVPLQPEYRIFEMNKRLTARLEFQSFNAGPIDPDHLLGWYENFTNDFFADEIPGLPTRFTIRNVIDDQTGLPRSYTVNRAQLPRFFKTFAEGNCSDLSFQVNQGGRVTMNQRYLTNMNGGSDPQHIVIFETDSCTMSSQLGKPMFVKACVEGTLNVEFVQRLVAVPSPAGSGGNGASPAPGASPQFSLMPAELLKIRNWVFTVKRHSELLPRACIAVQQDTMALEQLSKNITRSGLTSKTLNFLKILNVCEPMQELMARHKGTGMPPRDCLRQAVMHRVNNNHMRPGGMMPPPPANPHVMSMHQPHHHMMQAPGQFQRSNSQQMLAGSGPAPGLLEDLNSPIKSEKSSANSSPNQQSPGASTPGGKRRKRKSSTGDKKDTAGSVSASKSKKAATASTPQPTPPSTPNLLQQQSPHPMYPYGGMSGPAGGDVMTVGEPSLMGGDFGEEDERLITRLENNQFDTNISMLSMTRDQAMPMQMNNNNLIKPQSPLNNNGNNNNGGRPSRPPSSLILPPPAPLTLPTRPPSGYNTPTGQQNQAQPSMDPNSLINNPTMQQIHPHHRSSPTMSMLNSGQQQPNKIPTPPFQQPVINHGMPNNVLDDDLNGLESTIVSSDATTGNNSSSTASSSTMVLNSDSSDLLSGSGNTGSGDLFPVTSQAPIHSMSRPNSTSPTNNSNLINGMLGSQAAPSSQNVQPSTSSSAIASSSSSSSSPQSSSTTTNATSNIITAPSPTQLQQPSPTATSTNVEMVSHVEPSSSPPNVVINPKSVSNTEQQQQLFMPNF